MAQIIQQRVYVCHSPECAGSVTGRDVDPKPFGTSATCWACSSDLWTWPRFGGTDEKFPSPPNKSVVYPKQVATVGWAEAFANLWAPRQDESSPR